MFEAVEAMPALDRTGQALFWLAQKAGDRAAETIQDAIRDDPRRRRRRKPSSPSLSFAATRP